MEAVMSRSIAKALQQVLSSISSRGSKVQKPQHDRPREKDVTDARFPSTFA